jgi:DNA-binding CsgD family transcriptional regulator
MRLVAGDLATSALVRRLRLAPLSRKGMAVLADPHGVDPDALYETTGATPSSSPRAGRRRRGHPGHRGGRRAGRAARLSPPARKVLDAAEVLALVTEGLRNADIARRLFVSPKPSTPHLRHPGQARRPDQRRGGPGGRPPRHQRLKPTWGDLPMCRRVPPSTVRRTAAATPGRTSCRDTWVERTFPEGLAIPVDDRGAETVRDVVDGNATELVTWLHSYVTTDLRTTFCIYDGPSPEAIRRAAATNRLPVDHITEVRVLDPYCYR